ncbi:hypothetical protein [Pseudohongiella sp.]|uniref:Glycosyltransferase RgtA/B/C/D-like domain-containing protein n=1 Tax=marine sediment metagenome TaxID=412755 RepID=A0A0F9YAJ6_9ZZZZ|nr:hypothetical protein [Pseudohongiella sp.]HDZ07929.1 hypothetical protein [Pseudohongiella sp.]HEA64464.1 hypothetical protein [Pseudohongiella sp.]
MMRADAMPPVSGINRIRWLTVIISLLLSWLAVILNDQPNPDAYEYVRAAEIALQSGITDAYAHYQWAHYSLLLAGIHSLTGLDMFTAAHLVGAALFAIISVAFVSLVAAATPSHRVVWLSVFIILAFPLLNEFRSLIIRDTGFLAFSLLAMLQLLRYWLTLRLRHSIYFVLACLTATLFRPEAIAFWALTPLALYFNPTQSPAARHKAFALTTGISALVAIIVVVLVASQGRIELTQLLRSFAGIYQPFANNIAQLLGDNTYELSRSVFGDYAAQFVDHYTHYFLLAGLLGLLLVFIIDGLGLAVTPLLIYGARKRLHRLPPGASVVFVAWLLTALVILTGFILLTRFTTGRYTLLFCLIALLWLPFIVDRAWSLAAANQQLKRFAWIVGFLALFSAVDSHISFGASKAHLDEATAWLLQNTRADAPLVTNEIRVAYDSSRVAEFDRVEREMDPVLITSAAPGSIIAVTLRRSFSDLVEEQLASGQLRLLRQLPAERGGDFLIMEKDF